MTTARRPLAGLLALAALTASLGTAAAQETARKPDARILGIEEYHLPNGLRVVLSRDTAKPTFTLNLTVLVGSIHEGAGEAGMAHVFEHLLFRNLEGFPDVKETLKTLGAQYNGSTSFERTNFFETVNATDENLELAVRLEAARLGGGRLDAGDLEKEGKIVESEFDIGQTFPSRLLVFGMLGALFDFHAYSRSPIGTVEDFRALRIDDIRAFYKRYYRPDNAVVFLTGKFETAKALDLIERHFGPLKGTGEGRPRYTTREPGSMGERRYALRRPGDTALVLVGYRIPGMASPDTAASEALGKMLASEKTGPLYEALVGKGLASDVSVDNFGLRMASPYFALASIPKDKDPDAAEAVIIDAFEKKIGSLTAADLDRAKGVLERDYDRALNDSATLAGLLSEHEAAGSWKLLFVQREQIKALTLDAVQAFAAKYLRIENRVVGRFIPDNQAAVVTVEKEPALESYKDLLAKLPETSASVKGFAYTPANLQASLAWKSIGPAKVGVLAKEIKGDDLYLRIWIPFAGRAEVRPSLAAGEALGALLTQRTKSLDKAALAQKMGELRSKIDAGVGLEGATVIIRCKKDRLAEVAALAREMLRTPAIEEQQLREYVTQTEGRLQSMKDNPPMLIQGEVARMVFPKGDPRRSPTVDEQLEELKKLTLDGVLAFHRSFFGSDGMVASVVGDVTESQVQAVFAPLVEGWKSEKPFKKEASTAVEGVTTPTVRIQTPGKPSAFSILLQPTRIEPTSPDAVALDAAAWALFQDQLGSRVAKKIREDAALSYATGGQLVTSTDGDLGLILLFTVTKPENAGKAVGLIRGEIDQALEKGITDAELEGYKKASKNQKATARASDPLIAAVIVELKKAGLDFTWWAKQDEETAALTLDRVNAALRKYVQPSKMGLLEIGDFK